MHRAKSYVSESEEGDPKMNIFREMAKDMEFNDKALLVGFALSFIVAGLFISEDIYNKKVITAEKSPSCKVNYDKLVKYKYSKGLPIITYDQWLEISKELLERSYFSWEISSYAKDTIDHYLYSSKHHFDEVTEEIRAEGRAER